MSLDADRPNESLFHQYLPKEVAKVVKRLDSSSSTQCQYPAVRSTVEKIFARASSGIKSSRIAADVSLFKAWFNGRGSILILRAPDFFVAITTLFTHAVGSSTFASTPRFSKRSSSALNFSLSAVGIRREGVTEGSAFSSTLRWTVPGRVPRSFAKTSG